MSLARLFFHRIARISVIRCVPFKMVLRFMTVIALAVWFGGFAFYSTAVIATSQKVLHSQMRAGLITQQVTNWLNLISVPALAICAANWVVSRGDGRRFWAWWLGAALLAMVLCQVALFPMHRIMDGRIVDREIADEAEFFRLHRLYLVLSTAQWCATLGYIWSALMLWSRHWNEAADRELPLLSTPSGLPGVRNS